jgi:hypothetical protein
MARKQNPPAWKAGSFHGVSLPPQRRTRPRQMSLPFKPELGGNLNQATRRTRRGEIGSVRILKAK